MAPHAIDVPFVFDTVDTDKGLNGGGPAAQEMARRMSTAWANFARTGHPAAPGLPDWPAYSPADPRTMTLSDHPAIVVDPDSAERVAIQAYMKGYSPMTMDADRQTEGTRK